MENSPKGIVLHPLLLEILFAYKSKVSAVFRDVLGLYEINHISLTRINKAQGLVTLSSTPAMEYNLFSSQLWRYDQTYNPQWIQLRTQAYWQTLYKKTRYDELYYVRQIKHHFPLGLSLAAKTEDDFFVYSLASHKSCAHTRELFTAQHENFYKIGQYCTKILMPIFETLNDKATMASTTSSDAISI